MNSNIIIKLYIINLKSVIVNNILFKINWKTNKTKIYMYRFTDNIMKLLI